MKLAVLVLAACGAAQHPGPPKDGSIAGVARDHDTGDPVAHAELRVRAKGEMSAKRLSTDAHGAFAFDHLPPGRYDLSASFAGQPVAIDNIDVARGKTAVVDVTFTLGKPDPITVDFGDKKGEIDRYHPRNHAATGIIEGTLNDAGNRERVAGAVVTAVGPEGTLQSVTDDQGRYRFDDVTPGTYVVSADYSIAGHAQIEERRSGITVAGGEGVIVPLFIELTKQ